MKFDPNKFCLIFVGTILKTFQESTFQIRKNLLYNYSSEL